DAHRAARAARQAGRADRQRRADGVGGVRVRPGARGPDGRAAAQTRARGARPGGLPVPEGCGLALRATRGGAHLRHRQHRVRSGRNRLLDRALPARAGDRTGARAVRYAAPCLLALAWLALACGTGTKTEELPGPQVEGDHVVIAEGSPQLAALSLDEARPRSTPIRQYTGRLAWNDDVTVRVYSPVAGRVRDVKVNVGERVTGGQTLATISSPDFGQAQADARAADGQLRLAERTLARQRDVFARGAAAREGVDAAEGDYARALAEQQRTQAHLRLFGARDTTVDQLLPLRSPVAGMIAERAVSPGQEVRPDQILASEAQVLRPLFVVTDPTRLWVWLDVAEGDLAQLQPGESISLRPPAYPHRRFDGVLDLVRAALDPAAPPGPLPRP